MLLDHNHHAPRVRARRGHAERRRRSGGTTFDSLIHLRTKITKIFFYYTTCSGFCHPLRRRADSRSGELSGREQKGLWKRKAQNEKQTALYKSSLLLACCKFEDGLEINFIFKEFSRFALDLAGNCSVAANLHGFQCCVDFNGIAFFYSR